MRTEFHVSAGGVVYRRDEDGRIWVAVIRVRDRLALPKGLVEKGEKTLETAVREVQEETGLEVAPRAFIDKIDYWYYWREDGEKVRHHKVVYFYLMQYKGGDPSRHDFEVDEVLWLPIEEALQRLSYKSEREVVRKAYEMLTRGHKQDLSRESEE